MFVTPKQEIYQDVLLYINKYQVENVFGNKYTYSIILLHSKHLKIRVYANSWNVTHIQCMESHLVISDYQKVHISTKLEELSSNKMIVLSPSF